MGGHYKQLKGTVNAMFCEGKDGGEKKMIERCRDGFVGCLCTCLFFFVCVFPLCFLDDPQSIS